MAEATKLEVCSSKTGKKPTPLTARFKAWVCGHSPVGILGSNPAGAWMSVSSECFMLSGRGLCNVLITLPCVVCLIVCDQETPRMMWPRPDLGLCDTTGM